MIRTLIVDDSPSMRQLIRMSLASDPEIEVIAEAGNAREARDAVNLYRPDVMTLDVEMPEMNGLEFLARLMRARPMPVVMVSSLTQRGSDAAIRALSLGAVECVAKPQGGDISKAFKGLSRAIKMAAMARVRPRTIVRKLSSSQSQPAYEWNGKVVLIGSSTGGVDAIEAVLSAFPEDCPPVLITQHMPPQFLASFAQRLDRKYAPVVRLARDGEPLRCGRVLIAPGGATHLALASDATLRTVLLEGPKRTGHRPSVDVLFESAVPHAKKVVATILTGMGSDGAEGMKKLHDAGAFCMAQDEASCIVFGMPRVAIEKGGVDLVLPLSNIGAEILARGRERTENSGHIKSAFTMPSPSS